MYILGVRVIMMMKKYIFLFFVDLITLDVHRSKARTLAGNQS